MVQGSVQTLVARNRAPRVQIEYVVELYGAEKTIEIPFVMGVMADLAGKPAEPLPPVADRKFLEIDLDNFEARMKAVTPRVAFQVPNTLTGDGKLNVELVFESMDDFSPYVIGRKVESLNLLLDARGRLANLVTYLDGKREAGELVGRLLRDRSLMEALAATAMADPDSPPAPPSAAPPDDAVFMALLVGSFSPTTEAAREDIEQCIRTLARNALAQAEPLSGDLVDSIGRLIAPIDQMLAEQINLILHHDDFQKIEGVWRGLHHLVANTESDWMLKIRVMNLSKAELAKTLKRYKGTAWDQSPIFKQVVEAEFGQFGGEPFGCLVGDYYFDQSPQDVDVLAGMAQIAAAGFVPFIAGASPSLMQMDSWLELGNPRSLTKIFMTPEYAAWRALRESEDSRYLGLTMPRFLARLPYGRTTSPVNEFEFEEDTNAADRYRYTWANSVYAMAVNINRAFKLYGWCARIRGVESGGVVEGLPVHTFRTDDGGEDLKCPTEIGISAGRAAELATNGLIALVHRKNADVAVFTSAQSLQKPIEYDDPDATADASFMARLPYVFASCRFAHYLHCAARDRIGSFRDSGEMESWLREWIANYVDGDPVYSSEITKARRPLAAAEIGIMGVEGNPEYHRALFYLRPHYQLEGLTQSMRLVARVPSPRAS